MSWTPLRRTAAQKQARPENLAMDSTHFDVAAWRAKLDTAGAPFVSAAAGEFSLYLYRPGPEDRQGAHTQAEVYFIVSGEGTFESGLTKGTFRPGDALFVPAGEAHRFLDADDALIWAAFFGARIDGTWVRDGGRALTISLGNKPYPHRVWTIEWTGGAASEGGLGLVVGRHMISDRRKDPGNDHAGVVVYVLDEAGGLAATWVHSALAPTRPGGGSAVRLAGDPDSFEGLFEIRYTGSDGAEISPAFRLDVQAEASDAMRLTWEAEGRTLSGVGLIRNERLYATWGKATDAEKIGFSLLDLPAAVVDGLIHETLMEPGSSEVSARVWRRDEG